MSDLLHDPLIKGAIGGFAAAVLVDLRKLDATDGWSQFDWKVAIKHWAIGLVAGALTGAVLSLA